MEIYNTKVKWKHEKTRTEKIGSDPRDGKFFFKLCQNYYQRSQWFDFLLVLIKLAATRVAATSLRTVIFRIFVYSVRNNADNAPLL